jgi:alginate O-acetyltransferase complex protein AlgJ
MMNSKINNVFIILVFLSAIILPLAFSDKAGGEKSETENRYLATFPDILTKDTKLAPGLKVGLENWINDNAGFRTQFQKIRSDFEYHVFHVSPSNLVHIGEDGWFYYTGDNNLEIAMGNYPLTQQTLEKIRDNQVKIQKALNSKGIQYVIVFTPSKVSVYPEYLKGGKFAVRDTVIDIVTDYLRKNTTIPIINTKEDLLTAKASGLVYFKTDTHWNEAGAYVGYRLVINSLKQYGMIHSDPINITTYPSTHQGEFSAMMGDINLLPAEPFEATRIISPSAVSVQSGDYYNHMQDLMKLDNTLGYISYQNENAEKKRVLIYGDSFFASWEMPSLLAENFSNLDFVWSDAIRENVVKQSQPDIVILERTERYIYTLANDPDPTLIYEPLINPSAEIISQTTPTQIVRNQKYDINITVKNTGEESWSEDRAVRLCIFQDGHDYGYRVFLPDGVIINPGEEYTFTLKDFQAPPNNSTYLEYQMVEEGVEYFGQKVRVDITVK